MAKKKGLGRGLDALLGIEESTVLGEQEYGSELKEVSLEKIVPGRYQPRRVMSDEKLEELAKSIVQNGVIQPILVRPKSNDMYEIIAGERRWRAARLANLNTIPVLERKLADKEVLGVALIENIQREQLNSLEEAQALDRLIREFDMTHEMVAKSVGRSRVSVSNLVRLLELSVGVKEKIEEGKLDMGHGRALLSLSVIEQDALAEKIITQGLSVRETERLVRSINSRSSEKSSKSSEKDPDVIRLERSLTDSFGNTVSIKCNKKGKGSLSIGFDSLAELDGILERIRQG